jgi:hypothetical protein
MVVGTDAMAAYEVKARALCYCRLLNAVDARMPQYPLDDAFRDELPPQLKLHLDSWRRSRAANRPS